MREQLAELEQAYAGLPITARLAGALFAGKVFALLGAMVARIEELEKAGGPPISTHGEGDGSRTNRRL